MRPWLWRLLVLPLLYLLMPAGAVAQSFPQPTGYVNDFAGLLSSDTRAGLEEALRLFEQETTVEIAVVTLPDLGGTTVEDYASRLFERWGIGKVGVDNGVLLLVAKDERRVRIEVGYGMEPYITDAQTGRILDNEVVPNLRQENYSLGIVKGARAIAQTIKDSSYQPGSVRPRSQANRIASAFGDKLWLLFLMGAASVYLLAYMARTRDFWLGGLWGAGIGALLGWIVGSLLFIVGGVVLAGLLGLGLDALLSSAYRWQASSGKPTNWRRTWGGFSGAGKGPWTGGGGFGGFGGGRSGGGGASRGF